MQKIITHLYFIINFVLNFFFCINFIGVPNFAKYKRFFFIVVLFICGGIFCIPNFKNIILTFNEVFVCVKP